MTTESLLVKTKDNYIVVLSITYTNAAEKMRLVKQCERYCQSVGYADFDAEKLGSAHIVEDVANTEFLQREISGYHYKRQPEKFVNEMKNQKFPPKVRKPNVLHFDTGLSDDFFPEMIKNIGYHIEPKDELYQVRYNTADNKYELVDPKIRRAQVNHGEKKIFIVRNHFEFAPQDYARLQTLMADFEEKRRKNPKLSLNKYADSLSDSKDNSLFNIYAKEQKNINHLDAIVNHELKHIKNSVFFDGMRLKDDYKRMSVNNMYRLCVENERSAYLQQLVFCLNKYLKQGDYNDFSMFDGESSGCANHLKTLRTKEERLAFATNWPLLVERMMVQFNKYHQDYYDKNQFENNINNLVQTEPLSAPFDVDGKMFKKIRSLYYGYMIYNPKTGKEESVNLSKYITPDSEVKISDKIRQKLIEPAQAELDKRMNKFIKMRDRGEINPKLIEPAKALMRSGMLSDSFVNEVDGLNIGKLLEEEQKPEPTEVSKPKIPDDKASWSDELQNYWSKVDGYNELAKNNDEYSFNINSAKVSYSDKTHVNVSSNADFELYMKLLKEPSSKNNVIEFAPTLSKEQALLLYIACVNCGRKMSGNIPSDLSGIDRLQGVPAAEMNKFNHRTGRGQINTCIEKTINQPRTGIYKGR